ncbi:MAG: hypothetical protein KHZ29_01295 [Desulfovibrionaceae bacterium]|nr:hypothetical protein [Desulfovibrionaceae bacterium]
MYFSSFNPVAQPLSCSISSYLDKTYFVLLLPSIFETAFSAGPNTAYRFAGELAKQ